MWAVLLVFGGFFARDLGNVVNSNRGFYFTPESLKGEKLLEDRLTGPQSATEVVVIQSPDKTVDDADYQAFIGGLVGSIRGLQKSDGSPVVTSLLDYYEVNAAALVSADRRTMVLSITMNALATEAATSAVPLIDLAKEYDGRAGFTVLTSGEGTMNNAFMDTAARDLRKAELTGLPVALVILVLVFGAVVAAGVPLSLAAVAIVIAMGLTALLGRIFVMDTVVENIITMVGLAVGIDYSLLVVERFREERRRGRDKVEAIGVAGTTATKAVVFSGGTVIISLLALLLVPEKTFRSIGITAGVVVVCAVAAALTLLPAALSLLGDRVNAIAVHLGKGGNEDDSKDSFWSRVADVVMRRPLVSVVVVGLLLIVLAAPLVTMRRGFSGISMVPHNSDAYKAFQILDRDFSAGLVAPIEIVVDAPDVKSADVQGRINTIVSDLQADSTFGTVSVETNDAGNLALVSAPVNGDYTGNEAVKAVHRVRSDYVLQAFGGSDAKVYVTGESAIISDILDMVTFYTPLVFIFVLGMSFLLLLVLFRSVVVPVSAIIMNLLSVGAAYGLLVLVFQHGFLHQVFGFQQQETISFWVPLLLFALLFGISMDYHVFLVSRIRERFDQKGDNREAVSFGVRHTARIITGAALIMVTVFASFSMGRLSQLQQMGFGLAVAVIVDATVIRTVLVPATMTLLGRWNWYLPKWLEWLPDVRLGTEHLPQVAPSDDGGDAAGDNR